jgi:hypothetical protein
MKVSLGVLGVVMLLVAATPAFAGAACQKCTHDIQVQYRECRKKGKDQETCSKEGQVIAQACVVTCQGNKTPEEKPRP